MQSLTVGALSVNTFEDDDWISFIGRGGVASYSCSGSGLWGAIKPEVVEYGGDVVVNKTQYLYKTVPSTCCELIRVSPPAYAKDKIGTSFAAPKVTYIAAELQNWLPNEPTLLYKALIIQSARWTSWADTFPNDRKKDVLRLIGYGLTFSSKPRRTRKGFRGYFATWVDWMSSRFNEDLESFARRIISMPEEVDLPEEADEDRGEGIPWVIGARDNWGLIKGVNRSRSASQKDWAEIEAYQCQKLRGRTIA